jgi:hypothetical protein
MIKSTLILLACVGLLMQCRSAQTTAKQDVVPVLEGVSIQKWVSGVADGEDSWRLDAWNVTTSVEIKSVYYKNYHGLVKTITKGEKQQIKADLARIKTAIDPAYEPYLKAGNMVITYAAPSTTAFLVVKDFKIKDPVYMPGSNN